MTETLTFANFDMAQGNVLDIGKDAEHPQGVLADVATAFGGSEENLGDLLTAVAPHRDLQQNIDFAPAPLRDPEVPEKLGYEPGANPHQIGHDWAVRSGLQAPVFRPFMEPREGAISVSFDAAIIPDRVVRWMKRMTDVAVQTNQEKGHNVNELLIVPTDRVITEKESDQHAGLTRHDFAASELVKLASKSGEFSLVSITPPQPARVKGADIMEEAAYLLDHFYSLEDPNTKILLPTVAGNWVQTGAQAREAFRDYASNFDADPKNRQLWVRSDRFDTDPTGTLPPSEAQNSLSAIGNILRGIKLIIDLQQQQ